jgi:HK97 family phage major capsid protein
MPGGSLDQRLFQNAATGLSSGVPSDGGFLVAPEFTTELLRKTYETAILAPKCKTWEVGDNSDGLEIPYVDETSRATGSRWGGVRVYRASEAATVDASKPNLGLMDIRLEDMMGLCYATERLLRDATALESYIVDIFKEEFAFVVDNEIVRGTGAGQCLGLLNSGALVSVAKENGQASGTILAENIFNMWSRLWARSRPNAAWYINQDVEPQLHSLSLSVGTGGIPVYMPAGGLSQSPFATLYGRPVIPIEQCESLGTKGDIILADMSQYLLVKKADLEAVSSIHVRFVYNERVFRFTLRINGQPKWKTALQPYKGNNTLSPFVCLEDRS